MLYKICYKGLIKIIRFTFISLSTACGEPPLCMSCSALFAIKHAVEAFRKDIGKDTYFALGNYIIISHLHKGWVDTVALLLILKDNSHTSLLTMIARLLSPETATLNLKG